MIYNLVSQVNGVLWGAILVYALIAVGVWFTIRLGLLQVRHIGHMFSLLTVSYTHLRAHET